METFSASPVTGGFPSQRPVTWSFHVFYVPLNKRLSKQSTCRWLETPWRSLWCHCNEKISLTKTFSFNPVSKISAVEVRPIGAKTSILWFFLSGLCRSDIPCIHTGEDKTRYRLNRQYPSFLISDSSNKLIIAVFEVQSKSHIYWCLENIGAILQATFQIFLNENVWIFFRWNVFLGAQLARDNESALGQVMAWCLTGDKPTPDPMLTKVLIMLICHIVSPGHNEIILIVLNCFLFDLSSILIPRLLKSTMNTACIVMIYAINLA